MNQQKTLTQNGLVLKNFIFVLISIAMIFVGVYLTNHFFDTLYPSGLSSSSSLCDISQFWGCDKATKSSLGVILGMPTSVFGIIMGVFGLMVGFLGKAELERTAKTVFLINLIGCVLLFVFSLATLGSLCPMCTVYYILSAAAYFMFHKYSGSSIGIDPKWAGALATLIIIPMIGFNSYIGGIEEKKDTLSKSYIEQFKNLKEYGDPAIESPYKVHMGTPKFSDAPIRITVFSDFQCPYCKSVADQLPELISEFSDKINIQYMFYPLDANCNSKMKGGMHPYACTAAYFAACDKDKFVEVHDYIFENQDKISLPNLKTWAKNFGLTDNCLENKNVKDAIEQTLNAGAQYSMKSTPTIIINGKKLEGMVPTVYMKAILKSLIK